MSIEDRLRDRMQEAARASAPDGDWNRFEGRRRRYRRARLAASALVVASVVAAAAIVTPRLVGEEPGGFVDNGKPTPSETVATREPVVADGKDLEDREVGYRAQLPEGWEARVDEGGISVAGPLEAGELGDAGSAHIPARFFVSFVPTRADYDAEVELVRRRYAELERDGGQTTERDVEVGGRPAVSFGAVHPQQTEAEGSDDETYCPGCRVSEYLVYWHHGYTLQIRVVARDTEANEQWGGHGLQVVGSLAHLDSPAAYYEPQDGTVSEQAAALRGHESLETLAMFMDARMVGRGAARWLSADAQRQYGSSNGSLSLYSPTSNPHYERYTILRGDAADANSYVFVVSIAQEYTGEGAAGSSTERIFVGPGERHDGRALPMVIRGAEPCDAGDPCS